MPEENINCRCLKPKSELRGFCVKH